MLRLGVLFCALLFIAGCSEYDRAQWNEAYRDFNGDNMQLRYGSGSVK